MIGKQFYGEIKEIICMEIVKVILSRLEND